MKRIAIIAALALVAVAAAWYFTRPTPVAVTLVTAERGPVSATVANTRAGTVDACRLVQVVGDRLEPGAHHDERQTEVLPDGRHRHR